MRPLFEVGEEVYVVSPLLCNREEDIVQSWGRLINGKELCNCSRPNRPWYLMTVEGPKGAVWHECALRKKQDGSGATDVEGILNRLDIEVEA